MCRPWVPNWTLERVFRLTTTRSTDYRNVLESEVRPPDGVVRPRIPKRRSVVLTREVKAVLGGLRGGYRLVATLLYGAGFAC